MCDTVFTVLKSYTRSSSTDLFYTRLFVIKIRTLTTCSGNWQAILDYRYYCLNNLSIPTYSDKMYIQFMCLGWCVYTGCPRRNVQYVGRVFLMLNYTDITPNTYIQSWTVTEIMAIEKWGLVLCPRIVAVRDTIHVHCAWTATRHT
jgi:hypothetical protein